MISNIRLFEEEEAIAQFLNEGRRYPIKIDDLQKINLLTSNRKILSFVSGIIHLFGRNYLKEISKKLDSKIVQLIVDLDRSYVEIQKQLSLGNKNFLFDTQIYPTTIKIIQKFCPVGVSEEALFFPLQNKSYDLLPFMQHAFLYANCNYELIENLEIERNTYKNLLRHKTDYCQDIWFNCNFSLIKLFHSCGAYKIHDKTFFFGNVINKWLSYLPSRRVKLDWIYWLSGGNQQSEIGVDVLFVSTFSSFLIKCSVQAFAKNLGIMISRSLNEELEQIFLNEIVRSDLSYFSSLHDLLKQCDWDQWNRPSKKYLGLVQYFLKISDAYQLPEEIRSPLFEWMYQLKHIQVSDCDLKGNLDDFSIVWKSIRSLGLVNDLFYTDPCVWNLFIFLIGDQKRECWISLLYRFSKLLIPKQIGTFFYFFDQNKFISDELMDFGNKQIPLVLEELEIDDTSLSEEVVFEVLAYCFNPFIRSLTFEEKIEIKELAKMKSLQYFFSKKEKVLITLNFRKTCANSNFYTVQEKTKLIDSAILEAGWNFVEFSSNVFFLFRFQPEKLIDVLGSLKTLQRIYFESNRNCFFINFSLMKEILNCINQSSLALGSSCPSDETRDQFIFLNTELFLTLFFPPIQPLLDMFRISGLSRDKGIRWGSLYLVTHLGWYKPVLKNHSVGVYINWDVIDGYPYLFFCFYDQKTRKGHAQSIQLNIPIQSLQGKNRVAFFSFFYTFSQMVFKERPDHEVSHENCELDNSQKWEECFAGLSEAIHSYEDDIRNGNLTREKIDKAWDFVFQVRVAYRNLYLNQVRQIDFIPDRELYPWQIAKNGNIYENESLIPEYWQRRLLDISPYRPDPTEEFLQSIFSNIFQLNYAPEFLHLNLKIAYDEDRVEVFPIKSWVRCATDLLMGQNLDEKNWDARAIPFQDTDGYYITLSIDIEGGSINVPLYYPGQICKDVLRFQDYFKFHNLLLKSRVYRELIPSEPVQNLRDG